MGLQHQHQSFLLSRAAVPPYNAPQVQQCPLITGAGHDGKVDMPLLNNTTTMHAATSGNNLVARYGCAVNNETRHGMAAACGSCGCMLQGCAACCCELSQYDMKLSGNLQ